jgi:predicted secreted Zn-dependent protease
MSLRNLPAAFSSTVLVMLCTGVGASAEPKLEQKIVTYDVTGRTPAEIRASVNKLGPYGEREQRQVHAYTKWTVRWGFKMRNTPEGCDVAEVLTVVDAVITMPKLVVDPARSAKLELSFAQYTEKMMLHERGHVENGMTVARMIEAELGKLPKMPNCDEVMRQARPIGQRIGKEEGDKLDREYDQRTNHGALQGVVFPR